LTADQGWLQFTWLWTFDPFSCELTADQGWLQFTGVPNSMNCCCELTADQGWLQYLLCKSCNKSGLAAT